MIQDLAEIVIVLDRSGSMGSIADATIEGFNAFIDQQKKVPGRANVTLAIFDHEYEVLYQSRPLGEVPLLRSATYVPRGTTALFDAIGRSIHDLGTRLASVPEEQRPGKVIFVILTDGQENASRDYRQQQVREMVTHQREVYAWDFHYLGANQDAILIATHMGVDPNKATNFAATKEGVKLASVSYGNRVTRSRMGT